MDGPLLQLPTACGGVERLPLFRRRSSGKMRAFRLRRNFRGTTSIHGLPVGRRSVGWIIRWRNKFEYLIGSLPLELALDQGERSIRHLVAPCARKGEV